MRSSFILFTSLLFFALREAGPQGARANTLGAVADVDYDA